MLNASCPSCGAPIVFANKASLATICGACRSVATRKGQDLSVYGSVGEIQEDASAICIGTRGRYEARRFEVLGRQQVRFQDGTWNEWHIAFDDGTFGWLAESQGHFSIQRPVQTPPPRAAFGAWSPGMGVTLNGRSYVVSGTGRALVVAAEGSLPFPVSSRHYDLPFVDLTSTGDDCGTLDFSDDPESHEPRLFVGKWVDAGSLELTGLREELPAGHPASRAPLTVAERVGCPNCGASLEMHTGCQAASIHCQYCGASIDTSVAPYSVYALEDFGQTSPGWLLSLGDTGQVEGVEYRVIGIVQREAVRWSFFFTEYLLYHPLAGYRWLVESGGHYTWTRSLPQVPISLPSGIQISSVQLEGQTLKAVDFGTVAVRRVVGEFYWRVRVGDEVQAADYATPPYAATAERTEGETTWSFGRYMDTAEVAESFGVARPPTPSTVGVNQPNPYQDVFKGALKRWGAAVILLVLAAIGLGVSSDSDVLETKSATIAVPAPTVQKRLSDPSAETAWRDKHALHLGPYEVSSGPTTLQLEFQVPVQNSWAYFACSLYEKSGAEVLDFGVEVAFYEVDGEAEGSRTSDVVIPMVTAGSYFLRVEPIVGDFKTVGTIDYVLTLRRDVPLYRWLLVALGFITLPLIPLFGLAARFEHRRAEDN